MTPTLDVEKTPFEFFKLFVSDEMLNSITEQTNIYILQSKGAEKSILRKDIENMVATVLECPGMSWIFASVLECPGMSWKILIFSKLSLNVLEFLFF